MLRGGGNCRPGGEHGVDGIAGPAGAIVAARSVLEIWRGRWPVRWLIAATSHAYDLVLIASVIHRAANQAKNPISERLCERQARGSILGRLIGISLFVATRPG